MSSRPTSIARRHFISLSLTVLAGSGPTASAAMPGLAPAWQAALQKHAAWMKQDAAGRWHCGARDLGALTSALTAALGGKTAVTAQGTELAFTHHDRRCRVVLHFAV